MYLRFWPKKIEDFIPGSYHPDDQEEDWDEDALACESTLDEVSERAT